MKEQDETPPAVLVVFGTRPEAIKLCPVVQYLRRHTAAVVRVCVTAQHREMLDQVLQVFGIVPDYDLEVMQRGQSLFDSTARILKGLEAVVNDQPKASVLLVQGDTTTTLCGALAGFYAGVPVGHVEAGLRTGDVRQPFPEEMNRLLVTRLSSLHFAATSWAADNLLREGVAADCVSVTGNTGIDALFEIVDQLQSGRQTPLCDWTTLDMGKKLIVVTAHRRESFGAGVEQICDALLQLANRGDTQIVYPVHPNPNVALPVRQHLGEHPGIVLTDPLDYISFIDLLRRADVVLTDSGGVQEEAPSLGKPVLVMRDKTERPEAVDAGTAELVGNSSERIVAGVARLLDDPSEYGRRSRIHNPYGDGKASARIAEALRKYFQCPWNKGPLLQKNQ